MWKRVIAAVVLAAAWIFVRCDPEPVAAGVRLEQELAFAVAKVAANEGALWKPKTTQLVWQVVEHNAEEAETRLEFLQRHSGRALGLKPCAGGNCAWSRNLSRDAEVLPAGIASGQAGPKDWNEFWRVEMAPRWQAVLDESERLVVHGAPYDKPCFIPPRTWGSVRLDTVPVTTRNRPVRLFCKVSCDKCNDGFRPLPGGFRW